MRIAEVAYIDSSILVRAYLPDEPGHEAARERVFGDASLSITSAITEIELTSAICAAGRARRVVGPDGLLARVRADLALRRPVAIALNAASVLPRARTLCEDHRIRTLDALHLAVALQDGVALANDLPLVFATADHDQAAAARAEGLRVDLPAAR